MSRSIAYLVDENAEQRRAFSRTLNELLNELGIEVIPIAPLASPQGYAELLESNEVAALILDQKMEDGGVQYSGTELSSILRGFAPKLPIFILSNYTEDRSLFENGEADVDVIVPKKDIIDPTSKNAQIFKARFVRRTALFDLIVAERTKRYHDLLVKSLSGVKLDEAEATELGVLEEERLLPQQAIELPDIRQLEAAIEELKKRLDQDLKLE